MVFTAKIEDLEIRGKEAKTGKNGEYLVVKFDNAAGERFDFYKRGQMCDIWLKVTNTAKYTNFEIKEMKYQEDDAE